MLRVNIKLAQHSYPIVIGYNLDVQFSKLLEKHLKSSRLFVFFDANFYALHGKSVEKAAARACPEFCAMVVPSGERSKSLYTLRKIYDYLIAGKISRSDFILACGGGVTTDLIGYAAATTLRGIRWGAVSTTLLGMVDASIGGKTGINHKSGKNLIGAFWQPSFVICDMQYLHTLAPREMTAGLGEVLKYCGLTGSEMLSQLKRYYAVGNLYDSARLQGLIRKCVQYKGNIVTKDERESNIRMYLNLGHTFGHAIEKSVGYGRMRHGEAVILGLLAAVILSRKLFPKRTKSLKEYESLVKQFVKLVRYYSVSCSEIVRNMKTDKKMAGDTQKFVLLKGPGRPFIASKLNEKNVRDAIEETLSFYAEQGGTNV